MATILQRLKDILKEYGIETAGVQTISQALRKLNDLDDVAEGSLQEVTGNTISECLDDIYITLKLMPEQPEPSEPSPSEPSEPGESGDK